MAGNTSVETVQALSLSSLQELWPAPENRVDYKLFMRASHNIKNEDTAGATSAVTVSWCCTGPLETPGNFTWVLILYKVWPRISSECDKPKTWPLESWTLGAQGVTLPLTSPQVLGLRGSRGKNQVSEDSVVVDEGRQHHEQVPDCMGKRHSTIQLEEHHTEHIDDAAQLELCQPRVIILKHSGGGGDGDSFGVGIRKWKYW